MRLVTYQSGDAARAGIDRCGSVVPVSDAGREAGLPHLAVATAQVVDVVGATAEDRQRLAEAAAGLTGEPIEHLRLLAPVPAPPKILCIGLNYASHAEEARRANLPVPDRPIVFTKFSSCLVASREPVVLPAAAPDHVDYEGELGVVIGIGGKHIRASEAMDHVAGYLPFNDVSARDLQLAGSQWTMGKSYDSSAPCGPALVTADEVPDYTDLRVRTLHNDEVVQDGSLSELIFSIPELIEHISTVITLRTGDIIATGTPAGVGHARKPPRYLRAGDRIEVEIDGLGRLTNEVVHERVPAALTGQGVR